MFSLPTIKLLINKYILIRDIKAYKLEDYVMMLHELEISSYNQYIIDKETEANNNVWR